MKSLRDLLGGIFFSSFLFLTSFFGSIFIMGPVYLLLFINEKWFRRYNDEMTKIWLLLPGALFELVFGTKLVLSGDPINHEDRPLIIMNHRCRLDWMFYWMGLQRFGRLSNEKIIMKHELKFVPGPGWAMQNSMFIFLQRRWEEDESYLDRLLNYFTDMKYPLQLFLFPEGTNLCSSSLKKSNAFAEKNGLEKYQYTLHPRLTGFCYIVQKLRGKTLDTIHDVTVGYSKNLCYGEKDLLFGNFPKEIHLHVKSYKMDEIPSDSEQLKKWCTDRWAEKEKRLKKFYEDGCKFPSSACNGDMHSKTISNDEAAGKYKNNNIMLWLVIIFWLSFLVITFYMMWYFSFARWYSLTMIAFYILTTFLTNGTDGLQLMIHESKLNSKQH